MRSASRIGYSDLGVNRARIEALRAAFGEDERRQLDTFAVRVRIVPGMSRSSTVRRPSRRAFSMAVSTASRTRSESGPSALSDVLNSAVAASHTP